MTTTRLLRYLTVGACAQLLVTFPAIPGCTPASPPPAASPATPSPVSPTLPALPTDAAKALDRLSRRLHARIDNCERRNLTSWGRWRGQVENQKIESGLVKLLERYPADPRIGDALRQFYGNLCVAPVAPSPAMLEILRASGDPASLGLRLGGGTTYAATQILFAALALRPNSAPLWLEAANGAYHYWRIAFTTKGVDSLVASAGGSPNDCESRAIATAAEAELELELKAGLLARATRRLASLPVKARALLKGGEIGGVVARAGGTPSEGQLRDFRLDLAFLELVAGNADGAAPLLESARPKAPAPAPGSFPGDRYAWEKARSTWNWYRALAAWSQPTSQDPFEILLSGLDEILPSVFQGADNYGRFLGLAAFARREGYPEISHYLERIVASGLREELQRPAQAPSSTDSLVSLLIPRLPADAEILALDQETETVIHQLAEDIENRDKEVRTKLVGPQGAPAGHALAALVDHVYDRLGRPRPTDQTNFWLGERQLFARMEPPHPWIVACTTAELEAEQAKDGDLQPYTLDLFVLDRTGHHGYAIWSTLWDGGTVRLEGVDGFWRATDVSSWFSED